MPRARSRTPACSDEVLQGQSAKNVPGVIEHLEKHARTPRTAVKHGTVRSSTFLVDITRLSDRDTAHRPRFAEHTIGFVNVMLTSYYVIPQCRSGAMRFVTFPSTSCFGGNLIKKSTTLKSKLPANGENSKPGYRP